jgi:type II secretion system protein C
MTPIIKEILEKTTSKMLKLPWKIISIITGLSFVISVAIVAVIFLFLNKHLVLDKKIKKITKKMVKLEKRDHADDIKSIYDKNIFKFEIPEDEKKKKEIKKKSDQITESKLPFEIKGIMFSEGKKKNVVTLKNKEKNKINIFFENEYISIEYRAILEKVLKNRIIIRRENGSKEYIVHKLKPKVEDPRKRVKKKTKSTKQRYVLAKGAPPASFSEEGFKREGSNIQVSKTYIRDILSNTNKREFALKSAKAVKHDRGFKMTKIAQNSIYWKLGLQAGDIIIELNGIPLTSAPKAVVALNSLQKKFNTGNLDEAIDIVVERNGSEERLNISML